MIKEKIYRKYLSMIKSADRSPPPKGSARERTIESYRRACERYKQEKEKTNEQE